MCEGFILNKLYIKQQRKEQRTCDYTEGPFAKFLIHARKQQFIEKAIHIFLFSCSSFHFLFT